MLSKPRPTLKTRIQQALSHHRQARRLLTVATHTAVTGSVAPLKDALKDLPEALPADVATMALSQMIMTSVPGPEVKNPVGAPPEALEVLIGMGAQIDTPLQIGRAEKMFLPAFPYDLVQSKKTPLLSAVYAASAVRADYLQYIFKRGVSAASLESAIFIAKHYEMGPYVLTLLDRHRQKALQPQIA